MIDLFFISFLIQKITKHKTRKTKHGTRNQYMLYLFPNL
mgnify:CR=1 FL=1